MAINNTYTEKLKDPRWQKKRLEIFQRDNWCCQKCFDDESTLTVHHKRYIPDRKPWDYPDELLITLCESCHEGERERIQIELDNLTEQIREKFLSEDILEITIGIHMIEFQHFPSVVAAAYGWAMADSEMQTIIIKQYFDYLKKNDNGKKAISNFVEAFNAKQNP